MVSESKALSKRCKWLILSLIHPQNQEKIPTPSIFPLVPKWELGVLKYDTQKKHAVLIVNF